MDLRLIAHIAIYLSSFSLLNYFLSVYISSHVDKICYPSANLVNVLHMTKNCVVKHNKITPTRAVFLSGRWLGLWISRGGGR